jgi:hypothetical protein
LAKRTETLVAEARGKENKNLAGKKLAAAAAFSLYSPTLRMMLLIAPEVGGRLKLVLPRALVWKSACA